MTKTQLGIDNITKTLDQTLANIDVQVAAFTKATHGTKPDTVGISASIKGMQDGYVQLRATLDQVRVSTLTMKKNAQDVVKSLKNLMLQKPTDQKQQSAPGVIAGSNSGTEASGRPGLPQ